MRATRILGWLAAAAWPSVSLAANVTIEIDCHDVALTETSSGDPIELQLWFAGKKQQTIKVDFQKKYGNLADPGSCPLNLDPRSLGYTVQFDKKPAPSDDVSDLAVRVVATGSDAFWIDQVRVTSIWFDRSRRYGVDGKSGWCVSTDSDDTFGDDRQDGRCKKCVEFKAGRDDSGSCL
jgi:hypothetical protein